MKKFIEDTVKKIVDNPEQTYVEETIDENGGVMLVIHTDSTDMGKVIGREGKIIKALRELVKIIAVKEQKMVSVEIAEVQTS